MDKYMALMTLMSAAGMLLAVKGWRGRNRTEKQPVPVRVQIGRASCRERV